jgi:hypothetical protein
VAEKTAYTDYLSRKKKDNSDSGTKNLEGRIKSHGDSILVSSRTESSSRNFQTFVQRDFIIDLNLRLFGPTPPNS